jgi:transposase
VLLTAEGVGTSAIMRDIGKSKTCVWRWQERFADEGFESLLRDKTRPSRISKLDPSIAERVIALTFATAPGETTHWTGVAKRGGRRQRQLGPARLARSRALDSMH